jgi:hypothetical protein
MFLAEARGALLKNLSHFFDRCRTRPLGSSLACAVGGERRNSQLDEKDYQNGRSVLSLAEARVTLLKKPSDFFDCCRTRPLGSSITWFKTMILHFTLMNLVERINLIPH